MGTACGRAGVLGSALIHTKTKVRTERTLLSTLAIALAALSRAFQTQQLSAMEQIRRRLVYPYSACPHVNHRCRGERSGLSYISSSTRHPQGVWVYSIFRLTFATLTYRKEKTWLKKRLTWAA